MNATLFSTQSIKKLLLLGFLFFSSVTPAQQSGQKGEHPDWDRITQLVERIVNVDDGEQVIEVRNGAVHIKTAAIGEIVDRGPTVIPLLTKAMKNKSLSFDTFTRCYCACGQIIQNLDDSTSIYWSGRCETRKFPSGIVRVYPSGQLDEFAFRAKVVADIETKYEKMRKAGKVQNKN